MRFIPLTLGALAALLRVLFVLLFFFCKPATNLQCFILHSGVSLSLRQSWCCYDKTVVD